MLALTISMLFVFIIIVAYVQWRDVYCLKQMGKVTDKRTLHIIFCICFTSVASTLLLGGLLPECDFKIFCRKLGNYWLGFFLEHLFFILLMDIFGLMVRLFGFRKKHALWTSKLKYRIAAAIVMLLTVSFGIYGFGHAQKLYVNSYEVSVDKVVKDIKSLRIALVSDFHLGYSVGPDYLQEVVDAINANNPDLVVIAGDIYDNEYNAIQDPDRCIEIFKGIKSRYGVYAVYGNHDVDAKLVGGFTTTANEDAYRDERLVEFCRKSGFRMMEDEVELIEDSFYLIGRTDLELSGFGGSEHMELDELMEGLDRSKPVIDLVHEPEELQTAKEAGVDILLAGHTHAGQFFPLNIVMPLRWSNYWGYRQYDNLHTFVSSGVGVYGPNMRIMSDSEVMIIDVKFK